MAVKQTTAARTRLDRYERRTAGGLTALAVAFLVVYAVPVIWPGIPALAATALTWVSVAIWAAFVADLVVRVVLAERKWRFLANHPVDVLVVVVPALRPLRVLRVFTASQALLTRGRGLVRSGQAIVGAALLLVMLGALAVLDAERGQPGANITGLGDALWWSLSTVTTVGYGDHVPVTATGRLVAAALMVVGISLLGIVTATMASWFLAAEREEATQLRQVSEQLADLHAKIDRLTAAAASQHRPGPASRDA